MKLVRFITQGIKGLPDREFNFAHLGTGMPFNMVLVTGAAASGKTRLLEAIIAAKEDVGAYGTGPWPASLVREGHANATIHATWLLSQAEQDRTEVDDGLVTIVSVFGEDEPSVHPERLSALFRAYARTSGSWKVEYFHAGRHLPAGAGETPPNDVAEARLRLGKSAEKYRGVRAHLVDLLLGDALALAARVRADGIALRAGSTDPLSELRELVRPFLHGKVLDGVDPARDGYRVRFRDREGGVLDLDDLSAAEQQGVLFAVTFRRLGLDRALVLIDTPELHIHPTQQAAFLLQLAALGSDNQIIAATCSPELIRGVAAEQVLVL